MMPCRMWISGWPWKSCGLLPGKVASSAGGDCEPIDWTVVLNGEKLLSIGELLTLKSAARALTEA